MSGDEAGGNGVDDFAAFGKPRGQQPRGFDPGRGPSAPSTGAATRGTGSATLLGGGPAPTVPTPVATPTATGKPKVLAPTPSATRRAVGAKATTGLLGSDRPPEEEPLGAAPVARETGLFEPDIRDITPTLGGGMLSEAVGAGPAPIRADLAPPAEAFGGDDGFITKKRTGAAPTPTAAGAAPTPTAAATALTLEQRRERARLRTPTAATQGGAGRIATKILLGA